MIYKIPVTWQMWGLVEVEADNLDEAIDKAAADETPLPYGKYIDASFEVDEEGIELYNTLLEK